MIGGDFVERIRKARGLSVLTVSRQQVDEAIRLLSRFGGLFIFLVAVVLVLDTIFKQIF